MALPPALRMAHELTARALPPGGIAVDATAGNGHDTLHLARRAGPQGTVHAFDVREDAIAAARARVASHGAAGLAPVVWRAMGHEAMHEALGPESEGTVHVVMFNLGYLPGGGKEQVTQAATTLAALEQSLCLLAPGGLITVVAYPGHPGGAGECEAVHAWAAAAPQHLANAALYRFLNQVNQPAQLFCIEKRQTG